MFHGNCPRAYRLKTPSPLEQFSVHSGFLIQSIAELHFRVAGTLHVEDAVESLLVAVGASVSFNILTGEKTHTPLVIWAEKWDPYCGSRSSGNLLVACSHSGASRNADNDSLTRSAGEA